MLEDPSLANHSQLLALFRSRWPVAEWEKTGFFTEKFLRRINPHWLKFPPPDPQSHYWLALLYSVIMTIGVAGNSLVIYMFLRRRSLRTSANILVMNLAVSDFFLLLKMPLFIYNCLHLGPALGEIGCSLYGFLGGLTGTVSIMTLAAISVDRYSVIVHPMVRKARQKIYLTVLLLWLYGGVLATMPLLDIGFNRYSPEGYLTSCSFDYLAKELRPRVMIIVFFCMAWVVPFCIITACYTGICRCVLRVRTESMRSDSSRHCKESDKRKTELKVAAVVVGIVGLWFLSWTPYAVVALLGVSGREEFVTPFASMVPALFCKLASCVDPYVYAVTHPRFRQELKTVVRNTSQKQRSKKRKDMSQVRRRSSDCVEEVMVMINLSDVRQETTYTLSQFPTSYTPGSHPYTSSPLSYTPPSLPYTISSQVNLPSWYANPFYTSKKTKRTTSLRLKTSLEEEEGCTEERVTM